MKTERKFAAVATHRGGKTRLYALELVFQRPGPSTTTRGRQMTGRLRRHQAPQILDLIVGHYDNVAMLFLSVNI